MNVYDAIVIGAGVVGTSTAFHLAKLGARKVLVLDRKAIGEGTTSQSSGILRTHYSVQENVELAQRSWSAFNHFAEYLEDDDASAGLVKCGYMIWAAAGDKLEPLRQSLQAQQDQGIALQYLDAAQAKSLLPIAQFDDAELICFEPEAGFADAYLVATSFARAARRRGVTIKEGVSVDRLIIENGRVVGVDTSAGRFLSDTVVSTQNIWTPELQQWTGLTLPVRAERHTVIALEGPEAYSYTMPVFKDLASKGMLYGRSYGGNQMLVSEGVAGETLATPDTEQGDVSLDAVVEIGAQVAERFPSFETAGLATSWTGVYDVTPDWNPVLGPLPGIEGLTAGFGFSGHGFKLSPAVGLILAQSALRLPTEVSLKPYALERFSNGQLLLGKYGSGAVS